MKKLILLPILALLASCASISSPQSPGYIDHAVFFWMKNPHSTSDRQKLVDAIERLRAIECIEHIAHGRALASDRPVVDDSFDLGLLVRFKNAADLHSYEKDPRHMKEVHEVLLPLTKKIQVYDIAR